MKKKGHIVRNLVVFFGTLALTSIISAPVYSLLKDHNQFIICIYILAVAIIARWTDGYVYGIVASFFSVFIVNYIYTYPYLQFNFTMTGYPVAFICMLLVSIFISTLTTTVKEQEQIRFEAEKEKMRANLLRSLSHDIRTPLTTIVGATNAMLTEEKLSREERDELLKEINEDALGLIKMVENILSITKMGEDARINKTEELAEDIISSAIVKFNKEYPDITVEQKVPEKIIIISCDPKLIEQVLLNLLENAAVHGGVTTHIDVSFGIENGEAVFQVEDNGQGIDEDVMPGLFKDYVDRIDDGARKDLKRNMGIGLAVCSTIVKAHGGSIGAYNTEKGAKFVFSLPFEEK